MFVGVRLYLGTTCTRVSKARFSKCEPVKCFAKNIVSFECCFQRVCLVCPFLTNKFFAILVPLKLDVAFPSDQHLQHCFVSHHFPLTVRLVCDFRCVYKCPRHLVKFHVVHWSNERQDLSREALTVAAHTSRSFSTKGFDFSKTMKLTRQIVGCKKKKRLFSRQNHKTRTNSTGRRVRQACVFARVYVCVRVCVCVCVRACVCVCVCTHRR